MNESDYGMLKLHALNGAQRQADGAANVAEATRVDYLESKRKVDYREAMAVQESRVSGLAREVVQARSASVQPPLDTAAK